MARKDLKVTFSAVDLETGKETAGAEWREGAVDMPDVLALEKSLLSVMEARRLETLRKIEAGK